MNKTRFSKKMSSFILCIRGRQYSTVFTFTVVDKEGSETQFEIHTEKETVGEALVELGLIAGEESEYGLYVKTVNGITADYDKDGVYWRFISMASTHRQVLIPQK